MYTRINEYFVPHAYDICSTMFNLNDNLSLRSSLNINSKYELIVSLTWIYLFKISNLLFRHLESFYLIPFALSEKSGITPSKTKPNYIMHYVYHNTKHKNIINLNIVLQDHIILFIVQNCITDAKLSNTRTRTVDYRVSTGVQMNWCQVSKRLLFHQLIDLSIKLPRIWIWGEGGG